jgi:LysR family transcriptional activator of nhaA
MRRFSNGSRYDNRKPASRLGKLGWPAMNLNYLHLHHFYAIAREGQIAKAARRLKIGQPTLSTQLKQLEDALGFRLFERKKGETLRLTEKGEVIFSYAKEIFRVGDEMVAVAQGLKGSKTSHFRIGALDTLPKRLVFGVMKQALRMGDCSVAIFEDNADQLFEKLSLHQYDLVVSTAPAPQSEKFPTRARKLRQYPVIICGSGRFLGLRDGFPGSLRNQPLMLPTPDGKMRADIEEYLREHEIEANVVGEAQDAEILRLAALSGEAVVPLSYLTVEEDLRLGRLHVLGELEGLREELWISSFPRVVRNPIARRFMRLSQI